jgi:hypothetical protein
MPESSPLNPTNASLTHSITVFFDQDHAALHDIPLARVLHINSGNGVNIGQTSIFPGHLATGQSAKTRQFPPCAKVLTTMLRRPL